MESFMGNSFVLIAPIYRTTFFFFQRYYEGHKPVFVTTDFKIIEEVFIKQFSNFSMRKVRYYADFKVNSLDSTTKSIFSLNL